MLVPDLTGPFAVKGVDFNTHVLEFRHARGRTRDTKEQERR